jgi:hypothetical protein
MSTAQRNANYSGNDEHIAQWQAQADAFAVTIGRMHRQNNSTLTALDRLLLQELVVLWDNAYDGLDKETFLDLMTDEVEFISSAFGNVSGRQGMSDWFDTFTGTFTGKRHLLTNFVTVGQSDKATMLSYLTVFERIVNTNMVGSAIYYDEFVKQDAVWKMRKRTQVLDPGMNETEYGKSLINRYVASLKK